MSQCLSLIGDSDGEKFACSAEDLGSTPGEGNSCTLQYSCLEKSMDSGAWPDTENQTQLSD